MEDEKHILPELQICACLNSTLSSRKFLALHESSRAISKPRPKIRIIHVFAPEIIKTDVENFRELVQRLTGKPPLWEGIPKEEEPCLKDITGWSWSCPDKSKVVLGSLSRYYQEVEVEGGRGVSYGLPLMFLVCILSKQGSLLDLNSVCNSLGIVWSFCCYCGS